jgi:putative transposase
MLLRNDLLQYGAPRRRTVRILWIDASRTLAWLFDMDGKGCDVEPARVPMLEADVASGRAQRLSEDPWLVVADPHSIKPGHEALRDRAWHIVAELTRDEPAIYEARQRGQLIADYTARHGVSHPTIYRYLRRYWQRGQTPNALLPDYANSGARGKTRASTEGVKRGRPRREGAPAGINVDEAMRRIFRVAAASYQGTRFSRRGAYEAMLRDFFCERRVAPETLHVVRAALSDAVPSFGQFSYWLDQGRILRPPERPLPLPAHAGVVVEGRPGAAFQVAAVRADLQLVVASERRRLAGRPVVYLVSDMFSGMVTGFHVSLEAPSWQGALAALAHCAADKPRHAQRHARMISAQDWPCRHLPELLLVPGTLSGGDGGQALLNNFGVRCAIATPPDIPALAALERRFGVLRIDAPALQTGLGALDGALDIDQFTRLVIDAVLEHNLQASAEGPAPLQLWDWGVRERGAALKQYGEDLVRCVLLPQQDALVTEDGICLNGLYYSCAKARDERWFDRARQRGRWVVRVAYDAQDTAHVYLPDPGAPMRFHTCHLAQRSADAATAVAQRPDAARRRVQPAGQHASFERIVAGFVT